MAQIQYTIQIDVPAADERTAQLDMANVAMGPTADLNGEVTDATARLIAEHWASKSGHLACLSAGMEVQRTPLLDAISKVAREANARPHLRPSRPDSWPRELELLSTWVINHN